MSINRFGMIVAIATLLIVNNGYGQEAVRCPCYSLYGTRVLNELSRLNAEPLDVTTRWLELELEKADTKSLIALEGALAGYCDKGCSEKFRAAESIVANVRINRERAEDNWQRNADRLSSLAAAIVGAIVGAAITVWLTTRRRGG